jgi:hypothetical protein
MRWAGPITILLILLILSAGCGQRVPTRNTTPKNPWGNTTPRGTGGSTVQTPVVPTTTSPFVQVTVIPQTTMTGTPPRITPPQVANSTATLTLIDEKTMVFSYNKTAFNFELQNPPLLIEYTLTVPNITKTRVETDPVSGGDRTVSVTYPDPVAWFQVSVMDMGTKRVIVRDGYGGQYDVSYSKKVWVRYPGNYYIEFSGQRLSAYVKFWTPKQGQ